MPESPADMLAKYPGEWINDADIIRQYGDKAIVDLRALRASGMPLRARPHPNGQGLQWMLDAPPVPPAPPKNPFPIQRTVDQATGRTVYALVKLTCSDCGVQYSLWHEHERSYEHRAWVAEQRRRSQVSMFDDLKDETDKPLDTKPADKIAFGDVKLCPRCKGVLRPERKDRKGVLQPADTMCMDPDDKSLPCRRCKGKGVVQLTHTGP